MAMKATPVSEKLSVLDRLKKIDADKAKLDDTRAELLDKAKGELLAQGRAIVQELSALGFAFTFTDAPPKKSHKKQVPEKMVRHKPSGICPICTWATTPAHDKRSHRQQTIKAPFSEAELSKRGLTRVA
ncbi:MAG: hypothetical protein M3178_08915 [Pseudomonadota bacterium]|nr:hypothetical protein [Pseudomonadota bacterium]